MTKIHKKLAADVAIAQTDTDQRRISGIASTSRPDRVGDSVVPAGAKYKLPFPLLANHDSKTPVGQVIAMKATTKGLEFTAQLAKSDPNLPEVDRAWSQIKAGLVRSVSIGFIPLKGKPNGTGGMTFDETDIYELSLTPTPMNADAVITSHKSVDAPRHTPAVAVTPPQPPIAAPTQIQKENDSMTTKQIASRNTLADQIRKAVQLGNEQAYAAVKKDVVTPLTTTNTPALYYPAQIAGVIVPPSTPPLLQAFAGMGAPQIPPNARALVQADLIEASEVGEDDAYPAAAPTLNVTLSGRKKHGLILAFSNTLVAPANLDTGVVTYVQDQLETAAGLATDRFIVDLMTSQGIAAASVAAAFAAFDGDLRTAVFVGHPKTLATLQDAANPNVGPRGGFYKTMPALPSLAVPVGRLLLQDVKRIAVFDGEQIVDRSDQASLTIDTPSGPQVLNLFHSNMIALRITKYGDAQILVAPQVISL